MLHHPPRSNPDTHKAGDSPKAIPAGYAGLGRTGPAVQCAVIVGSHRFTFAAQFFAVEDGSPRWVMRVRNASGRTQAGAGVDHPPFCPGANHFEPVSHGSTPIVSEQHDNG